MRNRMLSYGQTTMEQMIGEKLRRARMRQGLTKEEVADKIGVSRQTVSNWETGKFYPDIASVIALSDLYAVSLDTLLKGDMKMIEHLEESTNVVKSRKKLLHVLLLCAFLLVWVASVAVFWLGGRQDAMGYSILFFYIILPAAALGYSLFLGWEVRSPLKWFTLIAFSLLTMLAEYFTFSLANMVATGNFNLPAPGMLLTGLIPGMLGLGLGTFMRHLRELPAKQQVQNDRRNDA